MFTYVLLSDVSKNLLEQRYTYLKEHRKTRLTKLVNGFLSINLRTLVQNLQASVFCFNKEKKDDTILTFTSLNSNDQSFFSFEEEKCSSLKNYVITT